MASMPARPLRDTGPTPPTAQPGDARRAPKGEALRAHRERFLASKAWALAEYADTLSKLAK